MPLSKWLSYTLTLLLIGCSSASFHQASLSDPGGIGGTGVQSAGATPDQGGIGGTGKQLDEGIGGTGRVAQHGDEGGIGGTGIVGTITAFGSIWVNDEHIHFNDQTPITINQAPATSGELQLGQVVAVDSLPDGNAYQARSIDIIHEVVGPIDSLALDQQRIEVLNQTILLDDATVLFNTQSNMEVVPDLLLASAFVEVSGLRQPDGQIVASRIDIIPAPEQIQLIGELEQTTDGQWHINEQIVEIDELLLPDEFDKRVLVSGQLMDHHLIAESIGLDSIETVLQDATDLIYEGYFYEQEMDGFINVGGVEFAIEDVIEFTEEFDLDETIRVNASLSDEGFYEADDMLIEHELEDYYIDLLEEYGEETEWHEEDYFEDHHFDEEYDSHEDYEGYDDYDEYEEFEEETGFE